MGDRSPDYQMALVSDRECLRLGRASEAGALLHVPAFLAGVLAAGHAEVEGLVEGLGHAGGVLALVLVPGNLHRIREGLAVVQHEAAQASSKEARRLQRERLGWLRIECVMGTAPLAERVGKVGHRGSVVPAPEEPLPGMSVDLRLAVRAPAASLVSRTEGDTPKVR